MVSDDGIIAVHGVSASAEIDISTVGRQQVVGAVVNALVGYDSTVFIPLRRVIEHDIQDDRDTVLMELFDQILELVDLHAKGTRSRVTGFRREKTDRRITPVIKKSPAVHFTGMLTFVKSEDRHQFDTVYAQGLEIRNLFHDPGKSPPVFDAARRILGKSPDMHLIDDQILHRDFKGLVALPVIILPDDMSPV